MAARNLTPGQGASRIPLQKSLVGVVLLVSVLSMALSFTAVYFLMRGLLYQRADDALATGMDTWVGQPAPWPNLGAPSEFTQALYEPALDTTFNYSISSDPPDYSQMKGEGPQTITSIKGREPERYYRALARRNDDGSVQFVAKSLDSERRLLTSLAIVELSIGGIALIFAAFAGNYSVRRALAPLRDVENTALAIADGDISRRVPSWPRETEVGKISYAVNTMVTQLQGSVEASQAKEEQMRRFVGDASHELRTPLTSIRGFAELYHSGMVTDADMVLSKIDQESGRMKLLVEDLLALTRAEGARLDKRSVDMLELCSSAVDSARAAFPERQVSVTNDSLSSPMVEGDPDRLHQVMLNLITNAFKHAGSEASVAITLRKNLDKVFIDVADDGVGMAPEDADHIFDRFYRADTSRNRASGGGSGLGLAITKSLVEQHGGAISVRTAPGQGSTFTISLPMLHENSPRA
ncbi:sensor histidine kinase [Corynebacterium timonense]|uniref:Sensor-like histidine kinase SenX3 n=1 Tax=Corynebacterium timonense TaxID=441500 RepID=A0A1H1L870_9CORY|nr:HAMP domain-containing sensor histidine kinase [Corynebacterium timonense]SDR70774.1 two-component system, OmpR family, sensor kinase [Corynebacterium timonense]